MSDQIDLDEWYTAAQAAERLTANSGRNIAVGYVRTLARYGKVTQKKLGSHAALYLKKDVDPYIVEARGEKIVRFNRQKTLGKDKTKKVQKPAA